MKQYEFQIQGMGCAHCVKSVTEALTAIGAAVEHCEIGSARIAFDGSREVAVEAIEDRGFTVTSVTEE